MAPLSLYPQYKPTMTETWLSGGKSPSQQASSMGSIGNMMNTFQNQMGLGGQVKGASTTQKTLSAAPVPTGGNPPPNPMAGAEDSARSQAQADIEAALAENEYVQNTLSQQSGQLETERTRALSGLETDRGRAMTEATTAKTEATNATQSAQNKALSTAQDIQKKNRNVLRALGILSSSAGGEMLTKPMTEYGTQSAELQQGLVDRIGKVEQWWMDRSKDFDVAKQDVEQKYADLKEKISNDLRFNAQQRGLAVKAGTAALNQRLQDINAQKVAYQQAAQQYSNNVLLQLAQMKMYQNPTADVSALYNTLLSTAQGGTQPQQVGIQQTEEQKRKQLLSSGLGTTTASR